MRKGQWRSLKRHGKIRYEEKKSVFVAQALPVSSAEDAAVFLHSVKSEYPDARHHVYAWRTCGDMLLQKYSDDGEPSGTAGLPVLDVLRKGRIEDAMIVVTRYFGGILLGTGGLVHAYGNSALLAVQEAGIIVCGVCELYQIMISYSHLKPLIYSLEKQGHILSSVEYGMDAVAYVYCDAGQSENLIRICADVTAGQAIVEFIREEVTQKETQGDAENE